MAQRLAQIFKQLQAMSGPLSSSLMLSVGGAVGNLLYSQCSLEAGPVAVTAPGLALYACCCMFDQSTSAFVTCSCCGGFCAGSGGSGGLLVASPFLLNQC